MFFERPSEPSKPGTPGWHNSAAFHKFAQAEGLYARSINGDAFSDEIKRQVIEAIRADLGQVDQVVYSLAARAQPSARRQGLHLGAQARGPLRHAARLDTDREVVRESTLEPATQDEIDATVAVMGGEDWQMWIDALLEAGVLAEGATTTAFTYLGERITHDIYWNGSIGAAKKDLDRKVLDIRAAGGARGDARVSVLKAVVTQASSAIPMMPLYLSLLFKVMKAEGTHEGCIEQVYRLYRDGICGPAPLRDEEGRLRVDDWELAPAVQTRAGTVEPGRDRQHQRIDGLRRLQVRLPAPVRLRGRGRGLRSAGQSARAHRRTGLNRAGPALAAAHPASPA